MAADDVGSRRKLTAVNQSLSVSFYVGSLRDSLLEIAHSLNWSDVDSKLELAWPLDVDRDLFRHNFVDTTVNLALRRSLW